MTPARAVALASLLLLPRVLTAQGAGPDWAAVASRTVTHVQAMIRMNTTNPPGNELPVARYLEGVLKGAGIETFLFEPAPGRGALVARIKGNGSRRPVILMGHMDVVGVERGKWAMDPFAGEIADGYLNGRGAIDDKGMLAANLMTMLLVQQHVIDAGGTLARDLVFVANADEEAGGAFGMGWLIANHPDLVQAEFALNEGGRTRIVGGTPLYVAVQNTEKVSHLVTMTARGPGGHASVPLAGNAISRLGRALAAVGAHVEPLTLTPTTREFFGQLSRAWPNAAERTAMTDVASADASAQQRGARVLERTPVFNAVLRTGISATIVHGGIRSNVIPSEAVATLNIRTLPGQSIDAVVARLATVVRDSLIAFAITDRGEDAPASDFHSAMFTAIADATKALAPGMVTVPYLSTGATDSARLRRLGMQAYGILPFPLNQDDEDRMHGNNERIPLASLAFGTRLVYEAIVRVTR